MRDSLRSDAPSAYPREYDTLAGSQGALLGDPQGVEGVRAGRCTSVTASRMTDAYGASTPVGVRCGSSDTSYSSDLSDKRSPQRGAFCLSIMLKRVQLLRE